MSEQKQTAKKKRTLTEDQRLNKVRTVPNTTKRAMRVCHLFAKILKMHFDDGICELMDESSYDYKHYTYDILNNLLLVGDIPRDILLGTDVKNIDITFNLRELTKIHLQHLTKYHSKKEYQKREIECVYFQHYMNKFEEHDHDNEHKQDNNNDNIPLIRFHTNPYIFNAQYFVDILDVSYLLQRQLQVEDEPTLGCISLNITGNVEHEGEDLKGCKCTFTDTFDDNVVLSVQRQKQNEKMEREMVSSYGYDPELRQSDGNGQLIEESRKRTRWKSITLAPKGMDYTVEFDEEYYPIDIEIYGTRIQDKLLTYDFSVNTAIIPLASIAEYFDGGSDDKQMAIWFWEYIIENGIDNCDAIHDITIDRVLRVPQPNKDKYIIDIHGGMHHFWRTVELMIRLPNFYIDDRLIDAHIEMYDTWLNIDYFNNEINRKDFVEKFVYMVVNYCYETGDVRRMLNVLEILEFNDNFVDLLEKHNKFCRELMVAIKARDYEELTLIIFVSYGYPFKLKSEFESQARQLQIENKELNTQIIQLKQKVDELEKSKVQLAINCTKAIDQFRTLFTNK